MRRAIARLAAEIRACTDELVKLTHATQTAQKSVAESYDQLQGQFTSVMQTVNDFGNKYESNYESLRAQLNAQNDPSQKTDSTTNGNDGADQPSVFPTSVESYLDYIAGKNLKSTVAKSEILRAGNLVADAHGEFVVVSGADGEDDIAVPQVARFSSNEEFGYYRKYFDCDAPASGEVWVNRPAIVRNDEVTGGWRVVTKGQLELKSP